MKQDRLPGLSPAKLARPGSVPDALARSGRFRSVDLFVAPRAGLDGFHRGEASWCDALTATRGKDELRAARSSKRRSDHPSLALRAFAFRLVLTLAAVFGLPDLALPTLAGASGFQILFRSDPRSRSGFSHFVLGTPRFGLSWWIPCGRLCRLPIC